MTIYYNNDKISYLSYLPKEIYSIIAEFDGDSPQTLEGQLPPEDRILIQNDEFYKNRILTIEELEGKPVDLLLPEIQGKGNPTLQDKVNALYDNYNKRHSEIDPGRDHLVFFDNLPSRLSLDNLPGFLEYDKAFNKIQLWKQLPGGREYLKSDEMRDLPLPEKASRLKTWIESNPDVVRDVQELDLENLKLSSIPEEIGLFTNLTSLNLYGNKIKKIENLGALNQLLELDLSHNQISKIENMDALTHLQRLDLSHNQIRKIENMDALTHLQWLDLSYNRISKIENMNTLTWLLFLSLSNNQISKMENMNALTQLQTLSLSNNQISKMENMDALTQLSYLNLAHNPISKIENMDALHQLIYLYLTKYHVYENSGYLLQFPDLKTILE